MIISLVNLMTGKTARTNTIGYDDHGLIADSRNMNRQLKKIGAKGIADAFLRIELPALDGGPGLKLQAGDFPSNRNLVLITRG